MSHILSLPIRRLFIGIKKVVLLPSPQASKMKDGMNFNCYFLIYNLEAEAIS
jgi:hypothetical protein